MHKTTLARLASCIVVLLGVTAAGCSDSGVEPAPRRIDPTSIKISAGDAQTVPAGNRVRVSVRVSGEAGVPAGNVEVVFKVRSGGGRVLSARALTLPNGIAASSWILGLKPGDNTLEATVAGLPPVTFTANGISAFNIDVRYIGEASETQRAAVDSAVRRWTNIVVNDIFDLRVLSTAGECFDQQPDLDETVDDLLLFVHFAVIDGPGRILGRAGPCFVRTLNLMPLMGLIELDVEDLVEIERKGALVDLLMHELGHTLGFGTIWPMRALVNGFGGSDPSYTGQYGNTQYRIMGGSFGVPVENFGGAGTRDSHWRESTFGVELMTGYMTNGGNLLSAFSIASLEDLGYRVNIGGADPFELGNTMNAAAAARGTFSLDGREELIRPRYPGF